MARRRKVALPTRNRRQGQDPRSPKPRRKIKHWQALLPQSAKVRRALVLLGYLSLLFGLLLVNQARIAQKGFDNARMENQIRRLSIQNAQKREDLLKRDDIARIREEAQRLGMRLPLEGQLKRIHVARQDYMRLSDKEDRQVLQEFDLQRALNNVAQYRRSIAAPEGPLVLPFGRDRLLQETQEMAEQINPVEGTMDGLDLAEEATTETEPAATQAEEINGDGRSDGTKPSGE